MSKEGAVKKKKVKLTKKMVKEGDPSITIVVKTGLNGPVRPGTGLLSSPKNPANWHAQEPEKSIKNRSKNRLDRFHTFLKKIKNKKNSFKKK